MQPGREDGSPFGIEIIGTINNNYLLLLDNKYYSTNNHMCSKTVYVLLLWDTLLFLHCIWQMTEDQIERLFYCICYCLHHKQIKTKAVFSSLFHLFVIRGTVFLYWLNDALNLRSHSPFILSTWEAAVLCSF